MMIVIIPIITIMVITIIRMTMITAMLTTANMVSGYHDYIDIHDYDWNDAYM